MKTAVSLFCAAFAVVTGVGVAAGSAAAGPILLGARPPVQAGVRSQARPDTCGQPVTEAINASGGAFLFPGCGGTMAKITYGPNDAPTSATFTFTSSTSNPAPSICAYAAWDTVFFPIEYVLVTGNASGTVFFQTTSKSSRIRVRKPNQDIGYSFWAYVNGHVQFEESVGTPKANGRFKFASPLDGQNLPLGSQFCFEFGEGP